MSLPVVKNVGGAVSNTTPLTVPWPNGHSKYDVVLLPVQTSNQALPSNPTGTEFITRVGVGVPGTPGAVMISLYWARATGTGMPDIIVPASGDHQYAKPFLISNCKRTGPPYESFTQGSDPVSDTALSAQAMSTLAEECLIAFIAGNAVDLAPGIPPDQWTLESAPLVQNFTQWHDTTDTRGTGGAFALWTGDKAVQGDAGPLAATGVTTTPDAWIIIALSPHVPPLSSPRADESPWAHRSIGAGGAWTQIVAGPDGTAWVGSDLGGAYVSTDVCDSFSCIGSLRGMGTPHTRSVFADCLDGARALIGSEHGIYLTTNRGATAALVSPDFYVTQIVQCATVPDIIYGFGHQLFNSTAALGYKSSNRGLTWVPLAHNLPPNIRVVKVQVHPTQPNTLYLVSSFDAYNAAPTSGMWKSIDGGLTWVQVGAAMGTLFDMAMDPLSPDTIYATSWAGVYPSAYAGQTHKSTDGGASFTPICAHTGAVRVKIGDSSVIWVMDTQRDPGNAEEGFWESLDYGVTFIRKSTVGEYGTGYVGNPQAGFGKNLYSTAISLGQDLSNGNVLFIGTSQYIYRSDNGGLSFEQMFSDQPTEHYWITRGAENTAVEDCAFSEVNASFLLISLFDLGLLRSLDGGRSFQSCNKASLTGAWNGFGGSALSLLHDPARAGVCWAPIGETADTSQMCKNVDYGLKDSWTPALTGPTLTFVRGLSLVRSSAVNNRTMYVTSGANGDIRKSTNDGTDWPIIAAGKGCRVTATDPTDANVVYAGGEAGLFISTNAGGLFTQIGGAEFVGALGTRPLKDIQWTGVQWITVDANGWAYVAIYGIGKGIYRTKDRGANFEKLIADDYSRYVAVDRTDTNKVYISSSKAYKSGGVPLTSSGFKRSLDAGASFADENANLPWKFAGPIAIDPSTPSRIMVGSPGNGFFIRDFGGVSEAYRTAAVAGLEESRAAVTLSEEARASSAGNEESRGAASIVEAVRGGH